MTLRNYEDKVCELSVKADRLSAVIGLLDSYYFERSFDPGNATTRIWWAEAHDRIGDVVGAISVAAASIKINLNELAYADIEAGKGESL